MHDWQPALEAHRSVLEQARKSWSEGAKLSWAEDRLKKYGLGAAVPSAYAFHHEIEDLLASDTFMVSPDMFDLANFALESFNRAETCHPEEMFTEAGFIYLPTPFVNRDVHGMRVAWRAVNYRLIPDMAVDRDGETTYEWGLRLILYLHIDDDGKFDDYPLPEHLREQARSIGQYWGYTHATSIPLDFVTDMVQTSNEGDPQALWLSFFRVLNRLMQEKIAVKTQAHIPRAQRRDYMRSAGREPPLTTVVELRRPKAKAGDGEREGGVLTNRHVVRGHWRNQWYPASGAHKQKWIASYIKGPEDGELIIKERIWVWDR